MKIVKCRSCSGGTHVFPFVEGGAKCFSCGKPADIADAVDKTYKSPYSFLNGKLDDADRLIAAGKFDAAKIAIGEVLETAPGPGIGSLPNSGEAHWRKLLADIGCKKDSELLGKGRLLHNYPAFANAVRYASADEKSVYISVEKEKSARYAQIKNGLEKREVAEKVGAKAESLLGEYKKELDTLQKQAQADIARLEKVEEELRETVIDCDIVAGEYKNSIDAVYSAVGSIKDVGSELTPEQKNAYEQKLRDYVSLSNQEIERQKKLAAADERYSQYSELERQRGELVSNIRGNVSKINELGRKIAGFLARIDSITKKYADAASALENGDYETVRNLMRAQ